MVSCLSNSVLYRVLRDMLATYPAHGVKASILLKRQQQLVWDKEKTVAQIHVDWMDFYERYDRAVALTQNLDDVTLVVPAQDWVTRFTEMQEIFPLWITALITNFLARFTSMKACWTVINTEALRQASSRKMMTAGRVLQLAEPDSAGAMEAYIDDSAFFNGEEVPQGTSLCGFGRAPGCWRCGSPLHLRRECPQPASAQEIQGKPLSTWAKQPGLGPATISAAAWPVRGQGAATTAAPTVAQMAAVTSRLDRQEAMFEAVLEVGSGVAGARDDERGTGPRPGGTGERTCHAARSGRYAACAVDHWRCAARWIHLRWCQRWHLCLGPCGDRDSVGDRRQ